ncbi:hypothetical protein F511_15426 [Dorcoceras hygrometricum]|uniref:Uncharacterized protein n=1 Tax=Dorcoceras hygrometricum TaxID=472368 RepID=A0A2Z7ACR6_9LAMI|nr:hypothetical protein F511_15426 [Dorcoceras hygrometricum]
MTSAVTSSFSRSYSDQQEDSADEKRCAIFADEATVDLVATQRFPVAAFEYPVARRFRRSFWSTRRKQQQHPVESLSAVATHPVVGKSSRRKTVAKLSR